MCLETFKRIFACVGKRHETVVRDHLTTLDARNREVRHDLKNVQSSVDYVKKLVLSMREDDTWRG